LVLRPGDTFHSDLDGHLWVVLTEPDSQGRVVCVNFTTQHARSDAATVCQAGEHPFFTHETVVAYRFAQRYTTKTVTEYLKTGTFTAKQPCSPALLNKVREGAVRSDFTPKHILAALRQS
jgi:hypothetical protein